MQLDSREGSSNGNPPLHLCPDMEYLDRSVSNAPVLTKKTEDYSVRLALCSLCATVHSHPDQVSTTFSSYDHDRQKAMCDLATSYVADYEKDADGCVVACKVLKAFVNALRLGTFVRPLEDKAR